MISSARARAALLVPVLAGGLLGGVVLAYDGGAQVPAHVAGPGAAGPSRAAGPSTAAAPSAAAVVPVSVPPSALSTGTPETFSPLPSAAPTAAITPAPPGVPLPAWEGITVLGSILAAAGRPLPPASDDPVCQPGGGCRQQFGDRYVLWSAATGARVIGEQVFEAWKRSESAALGYPTTSEYRSGNGLRTDFEHGSLVYVPSLKRVMTVQDNLGSAAVVIGDSQAARDTWVGQGLAELGWNPVIRGAPGTGYVQGNGKVANYPDALESGQWMLPWGSPGLVLLQGGGNDAGAATDQQIRRNAVRLIQDIRATYPGARVVMAGVISDGWGRRAEVDTLLGQVAAEQGIPFLSLGDWWSRYSLGGALLEDGRHFTAAGHAAAAPVFADELEKILPPVTVKVPDDRAEP